MRKRKAKNGDTERWHSLQSLQQWVYLYICHVGQRACVVVLNTASSWPRRDYMWQDWNQNISPGNGAGGLLIARRIQSYSSHPSVPAAREREAVNSLERKHRDFETANKAPYGTMTSLWYGPPCYKRAQFCHHGTEKNPYIFLKCQ